MKSLFILLSFITLTTFAQEPLLKANAFKPVFTNPENIQSADINGDGQADLVVSGYNNNGIQIYINQGDLKFSRLKTLGIDSQLTNFAIADFDGDGDQDIWLVNYSIIERLPFDTLLKNDGLGNFSKHDVMTPAYSLDDYYGDNAELLVHDWNGDGNIDFLKVYKSGPDFLKAILFSNDGQANFTTTILEFNFVPFELSLGKHLTTADFDRDGDMDLWSVHAGRLTVFINDGLGQFSSDSIVETNVAVDGYNNVIFGDINQNGFTDIQFFSHENQLIRFINQGNGTFKKSEFEYDGNLYFEDGGFSKGGFIDANGDGVLDLWLAGEYEVNSQLLLSSATGMFDDSSALLPVEENNRRLVLSSDLNSNGTDELVTIGSTGMNVWQLESESRFQNVEQLEVNKELIGAGTSELIDMNGDGKLDSVLISSSGIHVALSNSRTGFDAYKRWYESSLYSSKVLDMNNDGLGDVVAQNSEYELLYLKNVGNTFEEPVLLHNLEAYYFYGYNYSFGDVDSNGETDVFLFVNSNGVKQPTVWSQKNGLFESMIIQIPEVDKIEEAIISDLDGDGQAELVATRYGNGIETVVYEFTEAGVTENAAIQYSGELYSSLVKPFLGGDKQQIMMKSGWGRYFFLLEYDGQSMAVVKQFSLPVNGYIQDLSIQTAALVNDDDDWDFFDSYGLILSENGEYKRVESMTGGMAFHGGIASFGDIDGDTDQDLMVYDLFKGISTHINTTIDQDFSGQWYNPAQSGHGLQVEEVISNGIPQVNLSWYAFNNGAPIWLTGVGPIVGNTATVSVAITDGPQFGTAYNSNDLQLNYWGDLKLTINNAQDMTLDWDGSSPGYGQSSMALSRLSVIKSVSPTLSAINSCHTGSWFNPEENGHGFMTQVVEVGGEDTLILTWFTYLNGNQYWVYAQGPIEGNKAVLQAQSGSGGMFPSNYNPEDVSFDLWGEISFELNGNDKAFITWNPILPGFETGSTTVDRLTYIDRYRCH